VRRAEALRTRVIDIEGAERLTHEQVLQTAGLALGRNVFDVGPEEAQRRLVQHPWIAQAQVTRRLPGSYAVTLREQRAVAVLALDRLHLVADDGTVFKPLAPTDPVDLPVVTGLRVEDLGEGASDRGTLLAQALTLLADYREAGLWAREPLAEIHVEPDGQLSLYVGDDATYVRVGRPPYARKLARLRRVFARMQADKARPSYVYLDNARRPGRVTVRPR
jgi:hypothetical protein